MEKLKKFIRTEAVLIIAFVAAMCTTFFVPITSEYIEYIDFKVLAILFCLMIIVSGLKDEGLFNVLAEKMTSGATNTRGLFLSLVLICFFSSMLITNDVALITFVPFSILVLNITGQNDKLIFVTVMQTVAANLGSMLTPVGNPQNLYLFSFYNINVFEFFKITVLLAIVSFVLIFILTVVGKREQIYVQFKLKEKIKSKYRLAAYLVLFALSIAAVFRVVDYKYVLIAVIVAVLFLDKKLFKGVDYSLLATFVFFFVFTGNIGRLESITSFLTGLIKNHELIYSVLISQVISNVPAAVLLSNFTNNYKALTIGTNVGGLGTLVASLASLISYKFYVKTENSKPSKYLLVFTLVNISVLIVLLVFSFIFM
jgi:Na+/H+ antiporter NhaD/arsenite permease-like protein